MVWVLRTQGLHCTNNFGFGSENHVYDVLGKNQLKQLIFSAWWALDSKYLVSILGLVQWIFSCNNFLCVELEGLRTFEKIVKYSKVFECSCWYLEHVY